MITVHLKNSNRFYRRHVSAERNNFISQLNWFLSKDSISNKKCSYRQGRFQGGGQGGRPPSEISGPPVAPHLRKFSAKFIKLCIAKQR